MLGNLFWERLSPKSSVDFLGSGRPIEVPEVLFKGDSSVMDSQLMPGYTEECALVTDCRCFVFWWWPGYCVEDSKGRDEGRSGSGSDEALQGGCIAVSEW